MVTLPYALRLHKEGRNQRVSGNETRRLLVGGASPTLFLLLPPTSAARWAAAPTSRSGPTTRHPGPALRWLWWTRAQSCRVVRPAAHNPREALIDPVRCAASTDAPHRAGCATVSTLTRGPLPRSMLLYELAGIATQIIIYPSNLVRVWGCIETAGILCRIFSPSMR